MALSPWYFLTKLIAYATWMVLGLRLFRPDVPRRVPVAVALGSLRLMMGFGFGLLIWLGGSYVYESVQHLEPSGSEWIRNLLTYLSVYVPVRWVEWGLFEVALHRESRSWSGFFLGPSAQARAWRGGGCVISCLADVPVIAALGGVIPVGRFMC